MQQVDIPAAWEQAADRIVAQGWRKILVLGAADIGKSSFCDFLAQRLLAARFDVAVADADIGQKGIGPPAAIALGYPKPGMKLRHAEPAAFFFVGSTSPAGRFLPLVVGAARLARQAEGSVVVVNTTGLIHGAGRVLKGYKIEAVQPDVIIALERSAELASILRACRFLPVIRLEPSPAAHAKTQEERTLKREEAFAHYFAEASRKEFDIDDLVFQRGLLLTGTPEPVDGALYAERTPKGFVAVLDRQHELQRKAIRISAGFEQSLLCGVGDTGGGGVGLAIIEAIDFARSKVALFTPVERRRVAVIQFGDLYIGLNGREHGRVPPGTF